MVYSPRYAITDVIARNLVAIGEAKALIERAPLLPAIELTLQRDALVRSVHASIRLEGNRLEEGQVEDVIAGRNVRAWKKDVQEAKNYRRVLDFIGTVYKDPTFKILESTIREINRIILKDIGEERAGAYRTAPVAVKKTKTGETVFTPPDAFQVPILVKDLADWLGQTKTLPPVLEAGIAHYELVRIHPFLDGNGRSARALAVLVLYRRGYDIRRVFSVEDYADEHSDAYYGALKESDRQEQVTPFLEFWSEALANELSKVKTKISALSLDEQVRERIGQTYLNSRQWEAVLFLSGNAYLTRSQYQEIAKTSERTARRDLEELLRSKVLVAEGQGKALRYRLNHGGLVAGKRPASGRKSE